MNDTLSIIIPTHNASPDIGLCLGSIVGQGTNPHEVLVIDYASTDETEKLVKSIREDFVSFHSFDQPGIYAAMNRGIELATGKWILFLGADDVLFDTDVVDALMNIATEADLLLGSVENTNRPNKKIAKLYRNKWSGQLYWRNTVHHQGVIYKRSLLRKRAFDPSFKVLADYELNLYLLHRKTSHFSTSVFIAKSNASGLSKNFNKSLYREELKLKKRHLPFWAYLINLVWVPLKYLYKS